VCSWEHARVCTDAFGVNRTKRVSTTILSPYVPGRVSCSSKNREAGLRVQHVRVLCVSAQ
jgi:hypothetical protein